MAKRKIKLTPESERAEENQIYHMVMLATATRESMMMIKAGHFADSKIRNHYLRAKESLNEICDYFIKNIPEESKEFFDDAVETVYESLMKQIKASNPEKKPKQSNPE